MGWVSQFLGLTVDDHWFNMGYTKNDFTSIITLSYIRIHVMATNGRRDHMYILKVCVGITHSNLLF